LFNGFSTIFFVELVGCINFILSWSTCF
jgi:hypothetical protein